ncbi:hypothetical protein AB0G87_00280 [Streptomyces asoensis]
MVIAIVASSLLGFSRLPDVRQLETASTCVSELGESSGENR